MRLLLDTCTFLWLATDDSKLSSAARENCVDPANVVHFSALSALEITIKHRLGRLRLPVPPHVYLASPGSGSASNRSRSTKTAPRTMPASLRITATRLTGAWLRRQLFMA